MIKRIMAMITICLIVVCSALPVFADDVSGTVSISSEEYSQYKENFDRLARTGNTSQLAGLNYAIVIPDGDNKGTYYVSKEAYNRALTLQKQINSSKAVAEDDDILSAKSQVQEMSKQFNLQADVGTASMILAGIEPFITTVLGIMVWVVTAGMTVFTVCDLCYLYIPVFREKTASMAQSGNAAVSTTNKETGESKFRFVTDEAMYAVQVCTVESGKHPASVWIKKRIWAYVLLGIALFILLTGNITLIVNIVLNIVGGVADALKGFGA